MKGSSERKYIMEIPSVIDKLIEEHSDRAYITAYRLTGNQADAWDLVQETFLRVMKKAELYSPECDSGGWLHRIMYRIYLNMRRSELRRREEPFESAAMDDGAERVEYSAGPSELPEKVSETNELRSRIEHALNGLPAELRACVTLVDIEGCNYEEAADILDWPLGSVAGRLFRARRLLRAELSGEKGNI